MSTEVGSYFTTVSDVMALMAPHAGGSIPDSDTTDYENWLRWIQQKYEEASRRGFWRRLLKKSTLSLTEGDEEAYLPVDFQKSNSLYTLAITDPTNSDYVIDLADPDRTPDDQEIHLIVDLELMTDDDPPVANTYYGRWKVLFKEPIDSTQDAEIWYFQTPAKPTAGTDTILLPGDMIAFGALTEYFRTTNLEGSQDSANLEYENRLSTYLALEMIPSRHELLKFSTNPAITNRSDLAKSRFSIRTDRVSRSF